MPLSDSYKKHGAVEVRYNPLTVIKAVKAAMAVLLEGGERRVVALSVAALLVRMQAELADDTDDNTVELMRSFMKDWDKPSVQA